MASPEVARGPEAGAGAFGGEDADLQLARMIQEQERAFLLLAAQREAGSGALEGAEGPPAGADGATAGADDDGDAALARSLQEQEAREMHARMMAMAGLGAENAGLLVGNAPEGEGDHDTTDGLSYEDLTALGEVAGTVSRQASLKARESIRRATFAELKAGGEGAGTAPEEEEQCTICRMEFEDEDELSVLPCGHRYHVACLSAWLQDNKTCPICSRELPEE